MADPVKASVKLPWAKANRSTFDQNDKVGERSMKLTWKSIVDADKATALAELKAILYTDALVIDNGRTTYAGIWRNAGSGYDGRTDEYWMLVRAGWATALIWDEVRIAKADDQGPEGPPATALTHAAVELTIIVPNVANSASQTIIAGLIGTINNPTIQGVVRTGAWTCNLATAIERPQDGCHDIQATLFIATDYQIDPKVVSITALETTTEAQLFQQTNLPVLTFTQGVLTVLSAQLDKFRRWRVQRRNVTSTPSYTVVPYYPASGETSYYHIAKNQRTMVYPTPRAGYLMDPYRPPSMNPDGTWDWHAIEQLDSERFDRFTRGQYVVFKTIYRKRHVSFDSNGAGIGEKVWYRSNSYRKVTCYIYPNCAQAWNAGSESETLLRPPSRIGSRKWLAECAAEWIDPWRQVDEESAEKDPEFRSGQE